MAPPQLVQAAVRAARANGITPDIFLKLVKQESGFNARATSPAGAQGLTQLMPATARGLGVTDPYDPAQNLNAGAKYLATQLKAFGGDYRKALAAYNAGPGAVQKYGGVPPYAETQRYVRNILGGSAPTANPAVGGGRQVSPAVGAGPTSNPGLTPSIAGILNANNAILGLPQIGFAAQAADTPATPAAPAIPARQLATAKGGKTVAFIEHFAAPFGLTVTATTNGHHVNGSYHYRGRAVDLAGESSRMAALAKAALKNPAAFREMFYTGPGNPGAFIKNGRVYPNSQLDPSVFDHHHDHVHLAK